MKKDDLINDIKNSVIELVKEKYGKMNKAIEAEIDSFLQQTKEDLFRWTKLLEEQKITPEEFELLISAQKDVFVIEQLHKAGISKISLGHFKNKILDVVIKSVFKILL